MILSNSPRPLFATAFPSLSEIENYRSEIATQSLFKGHKDVAKPQQWLARFCASGSLGGSVFSLLFVASFFEVCLSIIIFPLLEWFHS
jgi:hypothetical protein